MYTAKHNRVSGGVALYDPTCDDHSRQRLELAAELRNAVGHGELVVYYQPKASLHDGTVIGVEALVRWRHPDRGLVPPDEFITIAEQTGTIGELTTYVLDEALAQCAHWQRHGRSTPISVNLSPLSLVDSQLADNIADALQRAAVPPSLLTLEITENSVVELGRSSHALEQLAALGVQISIDDFGTGFTSLAYLHALPVHEVKIDRSFVATLTDNPDSATIVKTIIDLGHNLHLRVVAEGVEHPAAWQHLAALGCDSAQGYLLTPPIPPAELDAWHAQLDRPLPTRPPMHQHRNIQGLTGIARTKQPSAISHAHVEPPGNVSCPHNTRPSISRPRYPISAGSRTRYPATRGRRACNREPAQIARSPTLMRAPPRRVRAG